MLISSILLFFAYAPLANICTHVGHCRYNFNRPSINFNSNGFLIDSENIFSSSEFFALPPYDEILYDRHKQAKKSFFNVSLREKENFLHAI
jgi:hypothetical protein